METNVSRGVGRWLLLLAGAAVAALVLSWATAAHLRRACVELDTPYLPLCPDQPPPAEVQRDQLRKRIAANPGDATAWTQLLTTERNFAALPGAALTSP